MTTTLTAPGGAPAAGLLTRNTRLTKLTLVTALTPMVWGSTYLVTTQFLPPGRPLLDAVIRALPAGLLVLAATRTLPKGHWWWRAAVLGALNIGVFFALLFVAAYRLPGGVAATFGAVQPLLVAGLAFGLLGERPTRWRIGWGVAGVLGVALVVLKGDANFDGIGLLAGIAAPVAMATGMVLTKRWGRPVPLMAFTGWQLTAGGLLLVPVSLLVEGTPPALTTTNTLGFVWLAGIGTPGGLRPVVPRSRAAAGDRGVLPRPAVPAGGDDPGLAGARPVAHPRPAGRPGAGARRDPGRATAEATVSSAKLTATAAAPALPSAAPFSDTPSRISMIRSASVPGSAAPVRPASSCRSARTLRKWSDATR
jgi:probable blue pigment (indigoidine) exporter